MKRLLLSGAMLGALLALVGSAQAADKKTLVFVVNGASDFWKAAEAGVKKAQGELPNYKLDFKYPEQSSAAIQTRLMDDLVAAGASGIMVSAVDPKTMGDALDRIVERSAAMLRPVYSISRIDALTAGATCKTSTPTSVITSSPTPR